ncbi:MAG: hypothetical protein J5950_01660 [Clostridia bacterium]|nr:hypothetical protein [Clostridia bacterium]
MDQNIYDIIIFGGQSNMQGQTEKLVVREPGENMLEYRMLTDELLPLKDPAGEDIRPDGTRGVPYSEELGGKWHEINVLGSAVFGSTTLLPSFCKAYTEETGRKCVAVHAAKGSTDIDYWLPGTPGFSAILRKANAAKAKLAASGLTPGRIFTVWLQGESDAIESKPKNVYKDMIACLAAALKTDPGIEKFGIIRVGRFTCDARDTEIIEAQDEICAENRDFIMLTTLATALYDDPASMNPFVGGHFSAHGLERLGTAAGLALGQYVNTNSACKPCARVL